MSVDGGQAKKSMTEGFLLGPALRLAGTANILLSSGNKNRTKGGECGRSLERKVKLRIVFEKFRKQTPRKRGVFPMEA